MKASFSGEWQIDEYLDSVNFAGIVVGIDNGGETGSMNTIQITRSNMAWD